jgi:RNA polymerase sigma factor (TIGR02999 family)
MPLDAAGSAGDVTGLLLQLRDSGPDSRADLTAKLAGLLYPELRRIAARLMRRERTAHTLQPTAVVHEAFIRLAGDAGIDWQDRAHFLGIAARVMRRVLVEHARRHHAGKRGGGADRVTLDDAALPREDPSFNLLAVDEVLTRLADIDARAAQVSELRVFGGLTVREIAHELGVSTRTVDADWAMARLWLARELSR